MEECRSTLKEFKDYVSKLYRKSGLVIGVVVLVIIISIIVTVISVSSFSFEVKEARVEFEKGVNETKKGIEKIDESLEIIQQQVEKGKDDLISLKNDAFAVIDDTEITLDNGLTDKEIEQALNNHKYGENAVEDGDLTDSKKNGIKFNEIWGIERGIIGEFIPDIDFISRLTYTHRQHTYRIDWNFFNQRETPDIGNIICVPSSATFLVNALGYNVEVTDIIKHFAECEDIKEFAETHFGDWIEYYIERNKLYQITGTFTYGFNHFMKTYYPDFAYELDYDYWTLEEIADYVEKFGLMSATYLPSWVLRGERNGGHMITITKVYRDFEGHIIAFGINDPFGNPNVQYRGIRGWDGKNVIIGIDDMMTVMKSYRDDHDRGPAYLYRILYLRDKTSFWLKSSSETWMGE